MEKPFRIEPHQYEGRSDLVDFEIPMGVVEIGNYAFCGCTGLTSVVIPSSVKEIGFYAFSGCTGLTSVEIPDSVKEIGFRAFDDRNIVFEVDESNPSYCSVDGHLLTKDKSCLIRGNGFSPIPDSVTEIESFAFSGCTGLTSVVIPSSVTEIGDYAFYGCTGLTSVEIPDSVKEIGSSAFWGCTGLTSVVVSKKMQGRIKKHVNEIVKIVVKE